MKAMRYRVMSIPGRREDGSDTGWYVFDYRTKKSTHVGDGDASQPIAARLAMKMNIAQLPKREQRRRGRVI